MTLMLRRLRNLRRFLVKTVTLPSHFSSKSPLVRSTMLWEPGGEFPRKLYRAEDMVALNALANVQKDISLHSTAANIGYGLTMLRQPDRGFAERIEETAYIMYMLS